MTAVGWLVEMICTDVEMYDEEGNVNRIEFCNAFKSDTDLSEYINKAKEMENQEKLKVQIAENESVLEMLRLHGNDSSIIRVFSRLESLKEQLKEL